MTLTKYKLIYTKADTPQTEAVAILYAYDAAHAIELTAKYNPIANLIEINAVGPGPYKPRRKGLNPHRISRMTKTKLEQKHSETNVIHVDFKKGVRI